MSLSIILVVTFLGACAPSQQARGVKTTGFLGDYSKLQPGGKGDPALIYLNPKTDFRAYDKFFNGPSHDLAGGEFEFG